MLRVKVTTANVKMSQVYAVVPETCDQVLQVCEGVDLFRDGILIIYLSLNLLIG